MIGIYKITNIINNKCYIGQSINIKRRWEEHLYANTHCTFLRYAMAKYGRNAFTFEVLEECPQDQLNSREQYWIQYYNSYGENGYNLTMGGDGMVKYSVEAIYETYLNTNSMSKTANQIGCHVNTVRNVLHEFGINLSEQQQDKPVECIDTETLEIVAIYPSIGEAARSLGVDHTAITQALNGKNKTSCGYYWQLKGENRNFKPCVPKRVKTPVHQLNKDTDEIIQTFNSAADAARALGRDGKNGGSQILAVCSGRKKSAFGYKWKRQED